jgi:ribosomal protein L29
MKILGPDSGALLMELNKLEKEEMKSFNLEKLLEVESAIRKELANLRMEIYVEKGKNTGKARALKKNLARILTFRSQKSI